MAREVLAIDQQDVRAAVIVIIDESAAGTHSLRQILLAERTRIMTEADSRLASDIDKVDGGVRLAGSGRSKWSTGQTMLPERKRHENEYYCGSRQAGTE